MRGIRFRLASYLVLALLPGLVVAIVVNYFDYRAKVDGAAAELLDRARRIAAREGALLGGSYELLRGLAALPEVRRVVLDSPAPCADAIATAKRLNAPYAQIGIVDIKGDMTCTEPPTAVTLHGGDRAWFKRVVAKRDFAVGDYVVGLASGKPSVHVAYPIFDGKGTMAGAVDAAIDVAWLNGRFSDLALEKGTVITLFDGSGTALARYPESEKYVGQKLHADTQRLMEQGEGIGEAEFLDGLTRIFAFAPLGGTVWGGLTVSLGMDRATLLATARRSLAIDLAILLSVAALGGWLVMLYGRRSLLRPIDRLAEVAARLTTGELSARIGGPYSPDELGQVAHAFDHMAETLEHRRRALHRVSEFRSRMLVIAGHDLRQPLQIMRMSHAVIARSLVDADAQKYLDRAEQAVDRLVHQLDLIAQSARLEEGQVGPNFEAVPIAVVIDEIARELGPLARQAGLELRLVPSRAVVMTDSEMLATILRNLVGNAVKYTDRGSILIGCRRRGNQLSVEVHDTGRGIPSGKLGCIFEAFYQLDPNSSGLGLGLSIVKRTAGMLGHRLVVRSTVGRGTSFGIVIPLAASQFQPTAEVDQEGVSPFGVLPDAAGWQLSAVNKTDRSKAKVSR